MELLINSPNQKRSSIGAAVELEGTGCRSCGNREIKSLPNVPNMAMPARFCRLAVWIFMKILILNCFLMATASERVREWKLELAIDGRNAISRRTECEIIKSAWLSAGERIVLRHPAIDYNDASRVSQQVYVCMYVPSRRQFMAP